AGVPRHRQPAVAGGSRRPAGVDRRPTVTTEHVTVAVAGGVATLTLNRPDKRNAMTLGMWLAVGEHATALAADPAVRVLVVTGAGEHFSAGADIAGFTDTDPGAVRAANATADDAL